MREVISLIPLSQLTKYTKSGTKASNLAILRKMGYNVPKTFVLPFESFEEYLRDTEAALEKTTLLLSNLLDSSIYYSVRSSANVEDTTLFSFAGQFTTQLNVQGIDAIVDAIVQTWKSSQSDSANSYRQGLGHSVSELKMAVIIQEMVEPEFSGVIFTRNPITGLDEVIVESVDGYGDLLVQEGVTPNRWVSKWGNWIEKPDDQDDRELIILKIIEEAQEIAKKFGSPIDLEWAYDGNNVVWLQMREITTLRDTNIYSNRISREFLPGIIKPLIWSVNIPVVNSSWKQLFIELIGSSAESININNLAKSFFYRAYFNMGVIGDIFELLGMPREALEILAGIEVPEDGRPRFRPGARTIRYLPRMVSVMIRKFFYSKEIEQFLKEKKAEYKEIARIDVNLLDEKEILEIIKRLFEVNTESSYVVILSQLLNNLYNMLLRNQLEKKDIELEKIIITETNDRLYPIDPKQQLEHLHLEYLKLDEEQKNILGQSTWKEAVQNEELGTFRERIRKFVRRFGHLSDSGNDFSTPTWRENPTLMLRMITEFRIPLADTTQLKEQEKLNQALDDSGALRTLYKRAAKYREYRESVNFLYTFGYGMFRRLFKRIEQLFLEKQLLEKTDDIFYLTYEEIRNLIQDKSLAHSLKKFVIDRKDEIERYKDLSLPDVIYNELPESALLKREIIRDMKGVATSRGHQIGPVRVVRGASDFDKIQEGDILVIPYSDVSWTPLFSKASAVVSESGGILSHCSIVAREYGIPAVVSVEGAMGLTDGMNVAVDGYSGKVQILDVN